jgi:PKHD-type hydroxylase
VTIAPSTASWFHLTQVLAPDAVAEMQSDLESASFADGRSTAHGSAARAKHNEQLTVPNPVAARLGNRLVEALSQHEAFRNAAWPQTILPPIFSRYRDGMAYGDHLDLPLMATRTGPLRTDLSLTVFLSDPASYDGGELVLHTAMGLVRTKGAAGDGFLYPSDLIHRVEPVTRGTRLVAVTWIQSFVGDPTERSILLDLSTAIQAAQRAGVRDEELMRLQHVQHRLLRRWAR